MKKNNNGSLERVPSGVPGFDEISKGGFPKDRSTIISGTTGSGKTNFAAQFLYKGIQDYNEPGVFVTFEETPEDIMKNLESFGWNVKELVKSGDITFVDASPQEGETIEIGKYNLDPLLARVKNAVKKIGAKRVAIDSIASLFSRFKDQSAIRSVLYRIASELKSTGATIVITAERPAEDSPETRFGIEEFVADNVVSLHYRLLPNGERARTAEIVKLRGSSHEKRDAPFVITDEGVEIFPRLAPVLTGAGFTERIDTGVAGFDQMFMGGVFKGSSTLLVGSPGSGKSIACMHFILEGLRNEEEALYIGFEESRSQIIENAKKFGWNFEEYERQGLLTLRCEYPDTKSLAEYLTSLKKILDEKKIKRVVVDSLSSLANIYSEEEAREFVRTFISYVKEKGATLFSTSVTTSLMSADTLTGSHLSTLVDNIILMKYVESGGELGTIVAVLKSRGSDREKNLRKFSITNKGIVVGTAISGVEGVMTGVARKVSESTEEKLLAAFKNFIGPLAESSFSKLKEQGLTNQNLNVFVDGLLNKNILKEEDARAFKKDISQITGMDISGKIARGEGSVMESSEHKGIFRRMLE